MIPKSGHRFSDKIMPKQIEGESLNQHIWSRLSVTG
jgi:hypothetical protein